MAQGRNSGGRRTALVHPWAVQPRGAERAFFEIARALPDADLYFLHHHPRVLPADLRARPTFDSFLQRPPFRGIPYRWLLPLLPAAAESLDLRGYDLVVSSSFGWVHGVLTGDAAVHVSYMHSPPRYLWGEPPPSRLARLARPSLAPVLHYARMWDQAAAARPDALVANSRQTALRIQRRYRRRASVVHPPVEVDRFSEVTPNARGHLVAIGELTPYKRYDLAVRAAQAARRRLVLIGDGPARGQLERLARGGDVHFAGRVDDRTLIELLHGASALVHPGVEDFGIAMVEAQAAGLPVIGAAAGGALEIVGAGGGALVPPGDLEALTDAIVALPGLDAEPAQLRRLAARFAPARFRRELLAAVEGVVRREQRVRLHDVAG